MSVVQKNVCWWVQNSKECLGRNLTYNPVLAWIDWGRNFERSVQERLCHGWISDTVPPEHLRSHVVWVILTGESVYGRIYLLRPSFFWDVTWRRSVAAYRRFGQPIGTNFKGLPSHIDLLFFIMSAYSSKFFFLFSLLHFLVLCLLYPPLYLHSSFVPPAVAFLFYASFLFLVLSFFTNLFVISLPNLTHPHV
jgi:hypothetical protein